MKKIDRRTKRMVCAALFLALAYVLPFLTGQIPQIGAMLCPMHIPVLLCGFICGWPWGVVVGFVAPLLRSLTLGAPILFPRAVCMALELATYGAISGILYRLLPRKPLFLYVSLLAAMIMGRVVWGISMFACLGISGGQFGFEAFIAGAVTGSVPGIIIQVVLVPLVVAVVMRRTK